jgi:hypothetical protein
MRAAQDRAAWRRWHCVRLASAVSTEDASSPDFDINAWARSFDLNTWAMLSYFYTRLAPPLDGDITVTPNCGIGFPDAIGLARRSYAVLVANLRSARACGQHRTSEGSALPLSRWRRRSDLGLLTVRARDQLGH